jgi:hypothetical protein
MIPVLKERFPFNPELDKEEKTWEKAIKARAFDTVRCYLPAGATTNVAWVGDLRHVNDHLATLRNHPLSEVREIALTVEDALMEKFPDSFSKKRYGATETYLAQMGHRHAYFRRTTWPSFDYESDHVDRDFLEHCRDALFMRPPKTELPYMVRQCGVMRFMFTLDFGSFRDVQRHRAEMIPMPLLTADFGFEEWYLNELPAALRKEAAELIAEQVSAIKRLGLPAVQQQYYLPMGMLCPVLMTGDLRAHVYFAELRATRDVHATLRKRAGQVAKALENEFSSYGLVLHLDPQPDRFDSRRGTHDIVRIKA